jgi:hypothetical protein
MANHIADIPKPFYAFVRAEFLYDQQRGHGEFVTCVVYGISSLPGRAWGLSAMLDNGALVQHLPVSAITFTNQPDKTYPLDYLQVWSCYGWEFTTHEYDFLSEMPVWAYLKNGVWESGRYLFTAAPYGDMYSMTPDQHKHFNFVQLDCGLLASLPGNRMMVWDSSFVDRPTERPKYLTNTHVWHVENIDDDSPFDSQISHDTSL